MGQLTDIMVAQQDYVDCHPAVFTPTRVLSVNGVEDVAADD